MARSNPIRALMNVFLGGLLAFSLFESATCLCSDDDDCCGPCMLCLCTQAIESPDAAGAVVQVGPATTLLPVELNQFVSFSFRPPTPPPRA
ncbi:MAG: hypothetical protein HZA91_10625 [Verrucomicrobia bacterium]|nr:hypothetical protein [Verrucomicrobiota bacterium]